MQVIPGQIKSAVSHVDEALLPLNSMALDDIVSELSRSSKVDIEKIISIIKTDVGLLVHCLQKLHKALEKEGIASPGGLDCISYLRWAGEEHLVPVLIKLAEDKKISNIGMASPEQMREFAKVCVSASTTEILAEKFRYSIDQGYSLAIVRKLGYLLIAWNYPSTFKACIDRIDVDKKTSLDAEIQMRLGFSPSILAGALLQKWGASEAAKFALSPEIALGSLDKERPSLLELCELGEAFAESRCAANSESNLQKAEQSLRRVKELLGPSAMHLLEQRLEKMLAGYKNAKPAFFESLNVSLSEEDHHISGSTGDTPKIVSLCQSSLRALLEDLYTNISQGRPKFENVQFLLKQVIPKAGFTGGCVFTLDPLMNELFPQGKIGGKVFRNLRPVILPERGSDYHGNQLIKSLWEGSAEVRELVTSDGAAVSCFSGPVGRKNRLGVLYLEMPQNEARKAVKVNEVHFHALCEALSDCLELV